MMLAPQGPALAVADPVRARFGRAVIVALWICAAFLVYLWVAKEVRPLYAHEPWRDDPYDTVVSFAFFFVPILALLCVMRAALCRRARALPLRRVHELLVATRLMLVIIAVTLAAEWVSVALAGQHATWNTGTVVLVAVLALLTVAIVGAAALVISAIRLAPAVESGPDWWADAATVVDEYLGWDTPPGRVVHGLARAVVNAVARVIRRSPFIAAGAVAVIFGLLLATSQALAEEGFAANVFLLYASVAGASMFSFLLVVGWHLGLAGARSPMRSHARRLVDSAAAACAALVAALAFRGALRPVAAMVPGRGPGHELSTFLLVALAVGVLVFVAETGFRLHRADPANPHPT